MGVNVSHDGEENVDSVDAKYSDEDQNKDNQIAKLEWEEDTKKKAREKERKRTKSASSIRAFEDNNNSEDETDKKGKKKSFSLKALKKNREDSVEELNGDLDDEEERQRAKSAPFWRRKSKTSETDIKEFKVSQISDDEDEKSKKKLPIWKRRTKSENTDEGGKAKEKISKRNSEDEVFETETEEKINEKVESEPKTPFWKRKNKSEDKASESKVETEPKTPFWKRKSKQTEDKIKEIENSDLDSDGETDKKKKKDKKFGISKSSPSLRLSRFSLSGEVDEDIDESKPKKLPFWKKKKKGDDEELEIEKEKFSKSRSKSVTSLKGSRLSLKEDDSESKLKKFQFWKRKNKSDDVEDNNQDWESIDEEDASDEQEKDKKKKKNSKQKGKKKSKMKRSKSMVETFSNESLEKENDLSDDSIDTEAIEEVYDCRKNRIISVVSKSSEMDDSELNNTTFSLLKRANSTEVSGVMNEDLGYDDSKIKTKKKSKQKSKDSDDKVKVKKAKKKKKGKNVDEDEIEDDGNLFQSTAPAYIHLAYMNKQKDDEQLQRQSVAQQEINPFAANVEESDNAVSEVEVLNDIDSDLDGLDEFDIPTVKQSSVSLRDAVRVMGTTGMSSSTMNMRELTKSAISVRDAAQSFLSLREVPDSNIGFFDSESEPKKDEKKKESFWQKRRRQKNAVSEFIIEESDSEEDSKSKKEKKKKQKDNQDKKKKKSKNDVEEIKNMNDDSEGETEEEEKPKKKSIFKRNKKDKDGNEDDKNLKKSKKKSKKGDDKLDVINEQKVSEIFNGDYDSDEPRNIVRKRPGTDSGIKVDRFSDSDDLSESRTAEKDEVPKTPKKKKKKSKKDKVLEDSGCESEEEKPKKVKRKFTFSLKKRLSKREDEQSDAEKDENDSDSLGEDDDDDEDGRKRKKSHNKRKSKSKAKAKREVAEDASIPRDLRNEPLSEPEYDLEKEYITHRRLYNIINDGASDLFIYSKDYLLLLDTRTVQEYNSSHIITAKHFSALQSGEISSQLENFKHVILYDSNGRTFDLTDSDLSQSYDIISESGKVAKIIQSGYNAFFKKYPFLCTDCIFDTPKVLKKAFPGYPTRILDDVLYLGNGRQSESENVINELLVTHIVNISTEHLDAFPDKVQYLDIQRDCSPKSKLYPDMENVVQFCSEAIDNHGCVFIHSHSGENRNAVMCIAVLMALKRCSLRTAYDYVKEQRSGTYIQKHLLKQLSNFERDLFDKRITNINELVGEKSPSV